METTLNKIKPHLPLLKFNVLLDSLSKETGDDEPLEMSYVLATLGPKCAMRSLSSFPFANHGKLLVRLCLDILPLYENDNQDRDPRNAIDAMRRRSNGEITAEQLDQFADLMFNSVQNASTEQSSTAAWGIYFAAKKDIASAIDAITACRTSSDYQQNDQPNEADTRAWQEITDRLDDRLNDREL